MRSTTPLAAATAPASAPAQADAAPPSAAGTSSDPRKASHFEVALVNQGSRPVSQLVLGLWDGAIVRVERLAPSASYALVLGAFPCRVALRDGGGAARTQSWDFGPCPHSGRGSLAIEIDVAGSIRWNLLHGDFFND